MSSTFGGPPASLIQAGGGDLSSQNFCAATSPSIAARYSAAATFRLSSPSTSATRRRNSASASKVRFSAVAVTLIW